MEKLVYDEEQIDGQFEEVQVYFGNSFGSLEGQIVKRLQNTQQRSQS